MNILDLPYELLRHVLSFNMYPYCNGVCKILTGVEDDLHMFRYRKIMSYACKNDPSWSIALVRHLISHDWWQHLFFTLDYIWDISLHKDVDDIANLLILLQVKGKNDIVSKIIQRGIDLLPLYDDEWEPDGVIEIIARATPELSVDLFDQYEGEDIDLSACMEKMIVVGNIDSLVHFIKEKSTSIQEVLTRMTRSFTAQQFIFAIEELERREVPVNLSIIHRHIRPWVIFDTFDEIMKYLEKRLNISRVVTFHRQSYVMKDSRSLIDDILYDIDDCPDI